MLIDAISPKNRLKGEEGQDLVEFALVVPMLCAILFGIIDYGWIFYNSAMVANSAREGARFAVMHYDEADAGKPVGDTAEQYLEGQVETNVKNSLPDYLSNSYANLQVTVTKKHVATDNDQLIVEVDTNIKLFTPIVSTLIGTNKYNIKRKVSMKKLTD